VTQVEYRDGGVVGSVWRSCTGMPAWHLRKSEQSCDVNGEHAFTDNAAPDHLVTQEFFELAKCNLTTECFLQ